MPLSVLSACDDMRPMPALHHVSYRLSNQLPSEAPIGPLSNGLRARYTDRVPSRIVES